MDPTACLDRLLQALVDKDRDESIEAAHDLKWWLVRGGFLPEVKRNPIHEVGHKSYELPTTPAR